MTDRLKSEQQHNYVNEYTIGTMLMGSAMNVSPNALMLGCMNDEKVSFIHKIFSSKKY